MVCGHAYSEACRSWLTPTRPAAAGSGLHPLMSVCGRCRIQPEHFCVYKKSVHVCLGMLGLCTELLCSDIIDIIISLHSRFKVHVNNSCKDAKRAIGSLLTKTEHHTP